MAFQEQVKARTYTSSAAIAQFVFVTAASGTGLVAQTGAGLYAHGVSLAATTATGQILGVAYDGRVQVLAAGTIAIGANVTPNATGRAVAAATGNIIMGRAITAAVSGQIVTIELDRAGTVSP
jgi:Uncharacterized conserved protein (DUF2190)